MTDVFGMHRIHGTKKVNKLTQYKQLCEKCEKKTACILTDGKVKKPKTAANVIFGLVTSALVYQE